MEADEPVIRAHDLMERGVITVSPETRVLDAHRLFVEEEIHGAPVVGDDGLVCGVVSALDLLRVVRDELEPGAGRTVSSYFRDQLPYSGPDWQALPEDLQDRLQELTVEDAMTAELVTVGPDAPVDEVARTMLDQRVHRVLVADAERSLLGVITSFDVLRAIAQEPRTAQPA